MVAREGTNGAMHDEGRAQLRGALARGDGAVVVQLLTGRPWPEDALQLIGDGLQVALARGAPEAPEPARECVAALRVRG